MQDSNIIKNQKGLPQKDADSNRLLNGLIQSLPISFAVFDLDGNIVFANQKALDLLGYSWEELHKRKLQDIVVPENIPQIKSLPEVLRHQDEYSFEMKQYRKDGTIISLLINMRRGNWGGMDAMLGTATDITAQKQVEQEQNTMLVKHATGRAQIEDALRTSEEKFHSLVRNIPGVIWTSDEKGNTSYISEGVTQVFGYTPEEVVNKSDLWFSRIHRDDLPSVKDAYNALFKHNILFDIEYRLQRKDGTWIWVHDRASNVYNKGNIRLVDGLFQDITNHKKAEEELRMYRNHLEELVQERTFELEDKNALLAAEIFTRERAEELLRESGEIFRTLAESSPNMIFINQAGKIVYVNKRFEEVVGYPQDEFFDPSFDFMILIAPEYRESIRTMFQRHIDGEERSSMEAAIITKDGQRIAAIFGSRLVTYQEQPSIIGVITDITAHKNVEEKLRQSEAQLKDAQCIGKMGSWEYDLTTESLIWSDEMFRLCELDPAKGALTTQEQGLPLSQDDIQQIYKYSQLARDEGKSFKFDLDVSLRSGRHAFFAATIQPVKDTAGRIVNLIGTVHDITDRKQAEIVLQEREQQLNEAQKLGKIGSWEYDILTQKTTWSNQVYGIFDRDPAQGPPSTIEEGMSYFPNQIQKLREDFRLGMKEGRSSKIDLETTLPSGRHAFISAAMQPIKDKNGQVVKLFGTLQDITDRKNAELSIQESEVWLKQTLRLGRMGSWELDIDTKSLLWSDELYQILERDPALGPPYEKEKAFPYIQEQLQQTDEYFRIVTEEGKSVTFDLEATLPSGKRVFLTITMEPIKDVNGRIYKVFGIMQDITDRKRGELILQERERQLKEAQKLGRIGSWEYDLETNKVTLSEQAFSIFDRDPALGPPNNWEEALSYYDEENKQKLSEGFRLLSEGGDFFKFDLPAILPSGRHAFLSTSMQSIKNQVGKVVKIFGTVQDITELKLAEKKLRSSEERYRLLFENAWDIISITDETNRVIAISPSLKVILGYEPQDFIGKNFADLGVFKPEDILFIDKKLSQLHIGITGKANFYKIRSKSGREVILEVISTPVYKEGKFYAAISNARDMTERIQAEEKMLIMERERQELLEKTLQISDLKSNLITQAAHELKTPLTSILGWAELLFTAKRQGKDLNETFDLEEIESILRNAERLDNIINDFLDVGRIESGKFALYLQEFDFNDILENAKDAVEHLARQRNTQIQIEETASIKITLDRRRMEQVVINLLTNAIKYSPEKSRVTIKTRVIEKNAHKMLQVLVIDEGYGFTAEELTDATTPFGKVYTRQEQKRAVQGTGQGLFISRHIIEEHGGTLEIRSAGANQGTQIEILLPMNRIDSINDD